MWILFKVFSDQHGAWRFPAVLVVKSLVLVSLKHSKQALKPGEELGGGTLHHYNLCHCFMTSKGTPLYPN